MGACFRFSIECQEISRAVAVVVVGGVGGGLWSAAVAVLCAFGCCRMPWHRASASLQTILADCKRLKPRNTLGGRLPPRVFTWFAVFRLPCLAAVSLAFSLLWPVLRTPCSEKTKTVQPFLRGCSAAVCDCYNKNATQNGRHFVAFNAFVL